MFVKPKETRFVSLHTVAVVTSAILLLPSAANAQIQYWAAYVGKNGNRDGIWHLGNPSWSAIPGGPPISTWNNSGNTTAYFGGPEGGKVNVTSPVRFKAIISDTMAPVTISGVSLVSNLSVITVMGSPLIIQSPVTGSLGPLDKTGPGLLEIGGPLSTLTLAILDGEVSLSGNNLSGNAQVINRGVLTMKDSDSISRYTQNGGTLAGTGTLTVSSGATIESGTISGKLLGKTLVTGDLDLSGSTGGGTLTISSGTTTLTGSSTNSLVIISDGASLVNVSGKLNANEASVNNSGNLTLLSDDTIHSYTQSSLGELAGPGRLTVSKQAALNGGRISGMLTANIRSNDHVTVSGQIGGSVLTMDSGIFELTGTSDHHSVIIKSGIFQNTNGGLSPETVVTNDAEFQNHADDTISRFIMNQGRLTGDGTLNVTQGATLRGGRVEGNLSGDVKGRGDVVVSGRIGGGSLSVELGEFDLSGISSHQSVVVSPGASLMVREGASALPVELVNAGTLTLEKDSEVITSSFYNLGGTVEGASAVLKTGYLEFDGGLLSGNILVYQGGVLNDGTVIAGTIEGIKTPSREPNDPQKEILSHDDVRISGRVSPATHFRVASGTLTLTGAIGSSGHGTFISKGATLSGDGRVDGSVSNGGALEILPGGDGNLEIQEDFSNSGVLKIALRNPSDHDRLQVGGVVNLGGGLVVTNTGSGLKNGQVARIIEAESFHGAFESFDAVGFDQGVLFDDTAGRLIGMGGGGSDTAKTYLNLNRSQTSVYLSLYEDAVAPGTKNVDNGNDGIQFITGTSNGDPQLVAALNPATFTDPGSIDQSVINRLSPEVHRGMADYTEHGLRSHVVEAVENAPESRYGETQVFATAHSGVERVDSSATGAGYDLDMAGVTTGLRYEVDGRLQIGGLLGMDFGSIEGPLVDTDAQGVALGIFGRYLIDKPRNVTVTASMAYGAYDYDATRHSFGGEAGADDISSDALELAVGVSTVSYDKAGFRVLPNATLRYLTGKVDRFTESGPGVNLHVGSQDIDSLLLDLGVDFEYEIHRQVTLTGSLGYLHDFQDSDNRVSGEFAATGAGATPFEVSAPGVEDEAFVVGVGVFYDLNESARVGLSYSSAFQTNGESAHRFGIGASFGF